MLGGIVGGSEGFAVKYTSETYSELKMEAPMGEISDIPMKCRRVSK